MTTIERRATLPTTEQCRTFRDRINEGRVAFGLEPLEHLEFDHAQPDRGDQCLSALNLIFPAGGEWVGTTSFEFNQIDLAEKLADVFGEEVERNSFGKWSVPIPEEILTVTDPFDASLEGLRERLVEADVVGPDGGAA